jgi:hypothetical protein
MILALFYLENEHFGTFLGNACFGTFFMKRPTTVFKRNLGSRLYANKKSENGDTNYKSTQQRTIFLHTAL